MNFEQMENLFDTLWPINRSITGPGVTSSLNIMKRHVPFEIREISTGTQVFDWTVPQEWHLHSASLCDEDSVKILSSEESNLHVLNFSEPMEGVLDFEELDKHLYSNPNIPDAIPYVSSYYERRWGFCISHSKRAKLSKSKKYKVNIDTEFFDGEIVGREPKIISAI